MVLTTLLIKGNDDCAICLNLLMQEPKAPTTVLKRQGEEITTTACGHIFHSSCLSNWSKTKRTCPVCREELPAAPLPT